MNATGHCEDCLKAQSPLRREDEGKYLLCGGRRVPPDGFCERYRSAQGLLDQMDRLIRRADRMERGTDA